MNQKTAVAGFRLSSLGGHRRFLICTENTVSRARWEPAGIAWALLAIVPGWPMAVTGLPMTNTL